MRCLLPKGSRPCPTRSEEWAGHERDLYIPVCAASKDRASGGVPVPLQMRSPMSLSVGLRPGLVRGVRRGGGSDRPRRARTVCLWGEVLIPHRSET